MNFMCNYLPQVLHTDICVVRQKTVKQIVISRTVLLFVYVHSFVIKYTGQFKTYSNTTQHVENGINVLFSMFLLLSLYIKRHKKFTLSVTYFEK